MHDHDDIDDEQVGRILGRREALALFGSAGAALLVACSGNDSPASTPSPAATEGAGAVATQAATAAGVTSAATAVPSCVVVPALTEGPYFVDENLDRSDIRSDPSTGMIKPGTPLTLAFNVSRVSAGSCTVLSNARVDIWHCDAQGAYSDVTDNRVGSTIGQKFLRGYQDTDARGRAQFITIYPGWYPGRAVHIHFKVRTGNTEFTSQLFFDETLSDQVFSQAVYQKSGNRTLNPNDGIYRQAGDVLLLKVTRSGDGYAATFDIGLQA